MLYQPQHTFTRWYPASYKPAVIPSNGDKVMMRADMVYRRGFLPETSREIIFASTADVYLNMTKTKRLITLKPVCEELRRAAAIEYRAYIYNETTNKHEVAIMRAGQLLTVVI